LIIGAIILAAGLLIYAVEIWHWESARREQHRLKDAIEGEARP
jgi:hypothetical protein